MKVICISGHAQNGKDLSAKMMQTALWGYGKRVLIAHNADLLKYICKQLFSWDGNKNDRGRTLLQYVGTDVVRAKKPDFWIDFIADVLEMFGDNWDFVLIPDCRFPNEINVLKDRGFDVVHARVDRGDFDNGLTDDQKSHPSETALDGTVPDITITNYGSTTDLTREVLRFIAALIESEEVSEDESWYQWSLT